MDFDDKFDRNWCFSFADLGIISTALVHNFFRQRRMGHSAGSQVTYRPTAAEIKLCRVVQIRWYGQQNVVRNCTQIDSAKMGAVIV